MTENERLEAALRSLPHNAVLQFSVGEQHEKGKAFIKYGIAKNQNAKLKSGNSIDWLGFCWGDGFLGRIEKVAQAFAERNNNGNNI